MRCKIDATPELSEQFVSDYLTHEISNIHLLYQSPSSFKESHSFHDIVESRAIK